MLSTAYITKLWSVQRLFHKTSVVFVRNIGPIRRKKGGYELDLENTEKMYEKALTSDIYIGRINPVMCKSCPIDCKSLFENMLQHKISGQNRSKNKICFMQKIARGFHMKDDRRQRKNFNRVRSLSRRGLGCRYYQNGILHKGTIFKPNMNIHIGSNI